MDDNGDNLSSAILRLSERVQQIIFDQSGFTALCVLALESEDWKHAIINRGRASCRSCKWTFAKDAIENFTIDFVPNWEDYPGSTHVSSDDLQVADVDSLVFAMEIMRTFKIQQCNVEIPASANIHLNFLFQAMSKLQPDVQFDTVEIVPENNDAERWNYDDLALLLESLVCNTLITHGMRENIDYQETVSINNLTINDRLWLDNVGLCHLDVKRIDINIPRKNFEFTPVSVIAVIQAWYRGGLDRLEHFSCTFYHDPNRYNLFENVMYEIPVLTDDIPIYPDPPSAYAHRIICRPVDQKCAYIGFKSSISDPQPVFWLLPWFPEKRVLPIENLDIAGETPGDHSVPDLAAERQAASNEDPVVLREEDPGVRFDEEGPSVKQIKHAKEDSSNNPTCSNIGNKDPIEAKLDEEVFIVRNYVATGSNNSNSNKRKRQSDVAEDSIDPNTKESINVNSPAGKLQHPDDNQDSPKYEASPVKRRRD